MQRVVLCCVVLCSLRETDSREGMECEEDKQMCPFATMLGMPRRVRGEDFQGEKERNECLILSWNVSVQGSNGAKKKGKERQRRK